MSKLPANTTVDVHAVALELLQQYGTRKKISQQSKELIEKYGQYVYSQIIQSVKHIIKLETKGKGIAQGKTKKQTKIIVQELIDAEREVLTSRYQKGLRYAFTVTIKCPSPDKSTVEDKYGCQHQIVLPDRFMEGDKISCLVKDYCIKVQNNKSDTKVFSVLTLDMPRKLQNKIERDNDTAPAKRYIISPSNIASKVEGYGKHICGKPFVCTCCGESFPARKGYRIELKEIYLCMDCKREVFKPTGRGWKGRFISTPMGNKR